MVVYMLADRFALLCLLAVDGVIVGNYRCNLTGVDLNRKYLKPQEQRHPTIFHLKNLIANFRQDRAVVLYLDLHGHSKKQDVFMYGCNNMENERLRFQVCACIRSA